MWLPRKKHWTIIDFGIAAQIDSFAETGFSLFYGAPEAIAGYKAGKKGLNAKAALDCWSLGILAIEMFTAKQPFDVMQEKTVVSFPRCLCFKRGSDV